MSGTQVRRVQYRKATATAMATANPAAVVAVAVTARLHSFKILGLPPGFNFENPSVRSLKEITGQSFIYLG